MQELPEKFLKQHTSGPYVVSDYISVETAWKIFFAHCKTKAGAWKKIQQIPGHALTIFTRQTLVRLKYLNTKYPKKAVCIPIKKGQIPVSVHDYYDAEAVRKLYGSDRLADVIKGGVIDREACAEFFGGKAVRKDYIQKHFLTLTEQLQKSAEPGECSTEEELEAYQRGLEHNVLFKEKAESTREILDSYFSQNRHDLNYQFMRGVFQKNTCPVVNSFVHREPS